MLYEKLNAVIDYIETHLDNPMNEQAIAYRAGMSFDTLRRFFPHLAGVTLNEYLRYRRMTLAGRDLIQSDVAIIDLAAKYGYDSAAAFSRAFQKFHGVNPSQAKSKSLALRFYPRLNFAGPQLPPVQEYEILELDELELYGFSIQTDYRNVGHDAPQLYVELEGQHPDLAHPDYGLLAYHQTRESEDGYEYWVLWREPRENLQTYTVPAARWLRLRVNSQEAKDIQEMSDWFYAEFLKNCDYRLRLDPELEHYHDGITDILFPIR